MPFGLSENEYEFIIEKVVTPLQVSGADVWCFGSRANETHNKFSDLDLLIESKTAQLTKLKSLISKIREDLEESNFPYKVDLVFFDDLATSYKDNVLSERVKFPR